MPHEDIKNGEGKVDKKKHQALYRDDAGELHSYSSICTHEECDIAWQSEDKNWECPCHGARFTPDGHVISGPAIEPLREIK